MGYGAGPFCRLIIYFESRQDTGHITTGIEAMSYALYIMLDFYNQLISGNYHEPTESLGYFHLELFYQSAAEMLKTQEQLRTNIQEVGGSFDGCRADIMDRVMFIIQNDERKWQSAGRL